MKRRVAIVGQGLMGLTSAHRLLEAGFAVTLFSKEPFDQTTSMSAGAYWWPHRTYPVDRVAAWAKTTYDEYTKQSKDPNAGVFFEQHLRFCLDPDDSTYVLDIVDQWERVDGADYGIRCAEAFRVTVPVIDVPIFMTNLKRRLESAHAEFVTQSIASAGSLFPEFELVVNCTGVDARDFARDEHVFPIRGQVVRVGRPEGLHHSTRIYQHDDRFTLVLPRTHDVILGGTAQEGDWDRRERSADTAAILQRCGEVVPEIQNAPLLGTAVGLRPGRHAVRLELDTASPGQPMVHNYGHGGGGYTVAWGCADEVVALVKNALS
ncbi:D-aspartate oxidase [Rhodopirellula maiorica SM1]|uniref:D-amino-acid oxidase n=1 Tax=Rhodopirellula maiorica SM1 TaxID=1265738 RepID=M5RY36_9BACT|nr:FAD-dependent oxidoreductase [Rhodopirellula maiorica]EMI18829.1 D-aspartate oxidase [Rhodopirellula maiorica SM1]